MGQARWAPAWPPVVFAALLLATAALLLRERLGAWGPGNLLFTPAAQRDPRCRHWAAVDRLGGCVAERQPGVADFSCCSRQGGNLGCRPCLLHTQQTLECIAPRSLLLRQAPGCGAALRPPPAPPPLPAQPTCALPSAAVAAGYWAFNDAAAADTPAVPLLTFKAAAPCAQQRPLAAAELPSCLWAAGIDRLVVSGDSTTRHLYSRLVALLRQQQQVIDGGASLVYGHYALTARWPVPAGTAAAAGAGGSGSSRSSGGSSGGGPGPGPPVVTDSLWFSPPGNILPGWFNDTAVADGLVHLLRRTAAARAAVEGANGGDGGGSSSSSSRGEVDSSRSAAQLTLDFVLGSHARWQAQHVRGYMAAELSGDPAWRRRTLLVLSLCIWEHSAVWPEGWLEFLADMRRQAGMIALVTCPLERMKGPLRAGARDVAGRRNEYLRQMVAAEWGGSIGSSPGPGGSGGSDSSGGGGGGGGGEPAPDPAVGEEDGDSDGAADGSGGFSGPLGEDMEAAAAPAAAPQPEPLQQAGPEQQRQPDQLQQQQQQRAARAGAGLAPLVLIDIDAMTRRLPQEVTLPPMDHHYQCYLSSASKYQNGSLLWAGGDGAPAPWYPPRRFDQLVLASSGSCADPVDYAAWQLLFSMLCKK